MQCRLCLDEANLCNSHIIPEQFFKPLYWQEVGHHRILEIPSSAGDKVAYFRQKGITEPLLCKKCETYLSNFEKYVKALFFGGRINVTDEIKDGMVLCHGVKYHEFKMFQLSVLWRAGVAHNQFWSAVNLGPHEEKLRRMLISQKPGEPHEYGCLIYLPRDKNPDPIDIIAPPGMLRDGFYRHYRFIFGGAIWEFIVANHDHSRKYPFRQFFLQMDGTLPVIPVDARKVSCFREAAQSFLQRGPEVRQILTKALKSANDRACLDGLDPVKEPPSGPSR